VRHFLSLAELTPDQLAGLLDLAVHLKTQWKAGGNRPLLKNKTLGMLFTKPSLRARVSFDMTMLQLGGQALALSPQEVGAGLYDNIADLAHVLSQYVNAIMARAFSHRDVMELAQHAQIPVINGHSDYSHPCQTLADLLTLREKFGTLAGLKLAYIGDGNNVANSLIFGAVLSGMHFASASPPGYEISGDVVAKAKTLAARTGATLYFSHDPAEAAREADALYTTLWTPFGQESEAQKRLEVFAPRYQVNAALVAKARRHVAVMHCLPVQRGQEMSGDVADGLHSALWDQAENRLHAQKAVLVDLLAQDYARSSATAAPARPTTAAQPKADTAKARPAGRRWTAGKTVKPKRTVKQKSTARAKSSKSSRST
jgi:ornithine carbamoyltransferase